MSTLGMALVMRDARRAATEKLHLLHIVACKRAGMTSAEAEQSYQDECRRERETVKQIQQLIAEHGRTAPASLWTARARPTTPTNTDTGEGA